MLPLLAERGIYTQLVTSAVRPIPVEWAQLPRLQIVVSIDGLQPEHDVRRTPATYDRILKHIAGHAITVHCTVTRQQVQPRRLSRGVRAVLVGATRTSARSGSASTRRRSARSRTSGCCPADRERVVAELMHAAAALPEAARCPKGLIKVYANAAAAPDECVFAQTTTLRLGGLRAPHHAVPVRRQARLRELRLHRVGRARRGRAPPAARRRFAVGGHLRRGR